MFCVQNEKQITATNSQRKEKVVKIEIGSSHWLILKRKIVLLFLQKEVDSTENEVKIHSPIHCASKPKG